MQAADIETGRVRPQASDRCVLQHPAVASLAREGLAAKAASEGEGPRKRRSTFAFMPGNLLGLVDRKPSGGGASVQSSLLSETQRSLASLESMMSGPARLPKGSNPQRRPVSVSGKDLLDTLSP